MLKLIRAVTKTPAQISTSADQMLFDDATNIVYLDFQDTSTGSIVRKAIKAESPTSMDIKVEGTSIASYNGSTARSVNLDGGTGITVSSDANNNVTIENNTPITLTETDLVDGTTTLATGAITFFCEDDSA